MTNTLTTNREGDMTFMQPATLQETSAALRSALEALAHDNRKAALVHAMQAKKTADADPHTYVELSASIWDTILSCASTTEEAILTATKWGAVADKINVDAGYNLDLSGAVFDPCNLGLR